MKSLKIDMNTLYFLLLLMLSVAVGSQSWMHKKSGNVNHLSDVGNANCSNESKCPTWFFCNSEKNCQCEDSDGIKCDNEKHVSAILVCYCVTYDNDTGSTYTGQCFYNCEHFNATIKNDVRYVYHYLPRDPEVLINNSACTHFHRRGILCGDCDEGHSPLVLSYNLSCIPCANGQNNWWKFILVGFLPLTLFYIFIVLFNVNVTSSRLHGVVWASQVISMPTFVRTVLFALEIHGNLNLGRFIVMFYSYWNLDFFHSIPLNICLNITTLQTLALEYLIALYPFVLISISYLMITLYSHRKTSFLLYAWKPFQNLQIKLQKSWDVRTSVIDSFSTFFLLSYVKILSVTCDLLTPTQIQQLNSNTRKLALYYSPSVPYFGDEHRPYAILALTILTVFVAIPTIIFILYPCQLFQKFLSLFPINWHFLHAFVDSFQGCYKDGTEPGTFDCRWFSVITLIIKPIFFTLFGLTLSTMYFIYALVVLLILIIVLINIEPYKKEMLSKRLPTDLMFYFQLSLTYIAIIGRESSSLYIYQHYHTLWIAASLSVGFIPFAYTCYLIGSWLFSRRKWIMCK